MKVNYKTYFKELNQHGGATPCLDLHLEVEDATFRDEVLQGIMKLLAKDRTEAQEKPSVLGFDTGASGMRAVDEED